MILASGSAASVMIWDASLISKSPKSSLPVILMMMPFAPSMLRSRSGLLIAMEAASLARLSPVPMPMPMSASPWFFVSSLSMVASILSSLPKNSRISSSVPSPSALMKVVMNIFLFLSILT